MEIMSLRKWIMENRFDAEFHVQTVREYTNLLKFGAFIECAFNWSESPEGFLTWRRIANRASGHDDLEILKTSWK